MKMNQGTRLTHRMLPAAAALFVLMAVLAGCTGSKKEDKCYGNFDRDKITKQFRRLSAYFSVDCLDWWFDNFNPGSKGYRCF